MNHGVKAKSLWEKEKAEEKAAVESIVKKIILVVFQSPSFILVSVSFYILSEI